jgi:hypothetical protein
MFNNVVMLTVGTLEISAGAPWVHIVNTTTLAGKRGSIERLADESLRIDTNVDLDQDSIVARIVGGPQHGIIRVTNFISPYPSPSPPFLQSA